MAKRAAPISRKWTSGSRSQRLSACGIVKGCSLDWVPDCPAGSATEGELIVRITLFSNCNALYEVDGAPRRADSIESTVAVEELLGGFKWGVVQLRGTLD